MPPFILALAVQVFKPPSLRSAEVMKAGWLSRHSSRPLLAVPRAHEPYVDLGPLYITKRHRHTRNEWK